MVCRDAAFLPRPRRCTLQIYKTGSDPKPKRNVPKTVFALSRAFADSYGRQELQKSKQIMNSNLQYIFIQILLQLAAQEANPVAKERLNATQDHPGKLIDEIRDSENDLRLQEAKFPPVGCDRRAPPAKVGINLFQSKLEIVAYNGDEGESVFAILFAY